MHLGVIVDHPKRDLPGAVMLAAALVRRGCRASIIPLYEQGVDVPLLGLDALIVTFARPANVDLVDGYKRMGLPVYVLDTEGGVLTESGANSPEQLARYVSRSGFRELLAGYFFWGSRTRDAFVADSGMPAPRLRTTGCPRFDYASPRWWDLLDFELRDYILVNANFPLVNPLFVRTPEEEVGSLVAAGWDRQYVTQMFEDLKRIMSGYVASVLEMARQFPDLTVLVRPHPFERARTYIDAFAQVPNIRVDGRGSVLNVIRNGRCVVHLNCGTSIEATMLRRLPVSLEYLNTPLMAKHGPLPSRISLPVRSASELFHVVANLEKLTSEFAFERNYGEEIKPWFHDNDGAAADRIVEAVLGDVGRCDRGRHSIAWSLGSSRRRTRLSQRMQALAGNFLGSSTTSRLRALSSPVRQEKHFGPSTVAGMLARIAAHESRPPPVCVHARHPWTGLALSTVSVTPGRGG